MKPLSYDAEGNIISSTDRTNKTTKYSYDKLGRVTRITYPDGNFTSDKYDSGAIYNAK